MGRALIVSAGASSNEYISARLVEMGYSRPVIIPSGAEARRRMTESDYELIVVNSPLPDEFGHEVCINAMEKTDAGVVFLVKAAQAEQLLAPLNEQGVLLLSKPFTNTLFMQSMHMAAASNHRLQRLRQENAHLQKKLAQVRLVSRAKCCLVEHEGMTETEAHRYIEKCAMDTRRDRTDIAEEILEEYEDAGV
ncbi:MAG: ANTAR domain-containing protein [Faecalibacterium prausnitzii]|nr:ANTAR domain-containing protein [Faecalibacterium prausnitzii]MDD7153295.1 ANTAR domain-containing protein [Faecalibacterium prausnitzii]MDY2682564.1 ANTAR domain-containing protein [Faecalibacterium prausnitzii]